MSGSWYLRTDLSQGFTLTGNIFLNGNQGSESTFVTSFGEAPVPEPSTMIFGALGLGSLLARKRKKA